MYKRILEQDISGHKFLSVKNKLFLEFVAKNRDYLDVNNFRDVREGHCFSDLDLNPWPTFISKKTEEYFERTSIDIINLIKSLPQRIFNNDSQMISNYYGIPQYQVDVLLWSIPKNHFESLLGRGDFIIDSKNDLKCIEFNIAAGLGGWEIDFLTEIFKKSVYVNNFIQGNNIKLRRSRFFDSLFQNILRAVERNKINLGQNILRIAIVDPNFNDAEGYTNDRMKTVKLFFETYFKENDIKGEFIFCNYNSIESTDQGLFYQRKQIHCLLELENPTPVRLLRIARDNKVVILNGAITYLMASKLNVSLLSEYQDSGLFTEQESEIIKKHIPWSRKLVDKDVEFEGKKVSLINLVFENQKKFVLKSSFGSAGVEVFIGSKISPEIWKEKVTMALEEKTWMVQEYIKPQEYWYQINQNDIALHEVVYGLFVFGQFYAGGFVRLLPSDNKNGVVNCSQGASESTLLVVDE